MSVVWTETATGQLVAIRDYLSRSSPAYAQSLADRIVRSTEDLAGQPYRGAEVAEYADPAVREIYVHPFRVLYETDGREVRVLAVIHSARLLPRTPPV